MIEYTDIGPSQTDLIKELWIKNKEYHEEVEEIFKKQYSDLVFEDRMKAIVNAGKELKITIAEEEAEVCAYCISTVSDKVGEIVSLHVLESKRGKGIGKQLTRLHIEWLKSKKCTDIGLLVAAGNELTIAFYKQLGLFPNLMYMQLKE